MAKFFKRNLKQKFTITGAEAAAVRAFAGPNLILVRAWGRP
jgi:hypothetical protein